MAKTYQQMFFIFLFNVTTVVVPVVSCCVGVVEPSAAHAAVGPSTEPQSGDWDALKQGFRFNLVDLLHCVAATTVFVT